MIHVDFGSYLYEEISHTNLPIPVRVWVDLHKMKTNIAAMPMYLKKTHIFKEVSDLREKIKIYYLVIYSINISNRKFLKVTQFCP
jgi:hypothetical protein